MTKHLPWLSCLRARKELILLKEQQKSMDDGRTHCCQKGEVMHRDRFGNTIQITPADPGWQAVYASKKNGCVMIPLACWALVHCGEYEGTATTGMIAYPGCRELVYAADEPHFLGYTYPGDTADWNARAQNYWASRMCDGGKRG